MPFTKKTPDSVPAPENESPDPLAALLAKAEADPDYAAKTLEQLSATPQATGLSDALLVRLAEALEKLAPPKPPRYVAVDGKTEVEPVDLPPGTVYYSSDFRIAEKKPKTKEWMFEQFGSVPFINQTDWLQYVIVDGNRFDLPQEEMVEVPGNVFTFINETIAAHREIYSGRQLRRETGGKVSIKAGALRPVAGFEDAAKSEAAA